MRKTLLVLFTVSFVLMCLNSTMVLAAAPKAVITVQGLSAYELEERGMTSPPSAGLKVVGKGELVYLSGADDAGAAITSYLWSFASLPPGSVAILDSTTTAWTTFIPDTTGQFKVKLVITTAGGTDDTTITITSAKYVGVGTMGGLIPDFAKGQCMICHPDKEAEWKLTGHASIFTLGIDGIASTHYAESCLSCHTVGYDTLATAVNGGFDDVQKQLGWVFPTPPAAGEWDKIVANFPALAHVSNIQCENCHGPGSLHKADISKTDVSLSASVCSKCHDEPWRHIKSEQWRNSLHSVGVASAAGRAGCADCHSGYGFINKVDPDQPFTVGTGFSQTSCQVCHDPHSNANLAQVRTISPVTLLNDEVVDFKVGNLCANCHHARRNGEVAAQAWFSHFGAHGSPQADMLAGTNAVEFGLNIPSSNHKKVIENGCIGCHMSPTPGTGVAPGPGQAGRDHIGEHSFAMSWDAGTPDNAADDIDNVSGCVGCHGDVKSFEDFKAKVDYDGDGVIESAQEEIHGLLDEVGMMLPPIGSPEVAVETASTNPNYTPVQLQAAYNYMFIIEDGSYGLHNFQYAVNLLKASYAALSTGDLGAGLIESITDVPNDQGKKVRVVWNRFSGDGVGSNPVKYYGLWRRVDDLNVAPLKKEIPVYESLTALPTAVAKLEVGTRVTMTNGLWDFAGTVPADGIDQYSAIAPTLFDSTKLSGVYWSVFVVSGHTDIPSIYAVSNPDSGYSIDNLVPAAPTGLVAKEAVAGAVVNWDDPVDADFKYFAVYRSPNAGVDLNTLTPITTTTETSFQDAAVVKGKTYFYRVTAVDFSGNQSQPSPEVSLLITKVEGAGLTEVPVDFDLRQNYPNPFNPSTEIAFGLPKEDVVKLVVYNVLGAQVRTLAEGKFGVGYHSLIWDGADDFGRLVGPGMYFYRLETSSTTLTKKMIFLK